MIKNITENVTAQIEEKIAEDEGEDQVKNFHKTILIGEWIKCIHIICRFLVIYKRTNTILAQKTYAKIQMLR